jgi:hypothetical protein
MPSPQAPNTSELRLGFSTDSTHALPSQLSTTTTVQSSSSIAGIRGDLYEFFMKFLDKFYGAGFLLNDGAASSCLPPIVPEG